MAIRPALAVATALLGAVPLAPAAEAAPPTILFGFRPSVSNADNGEPLFAVVCEATVVPGGVPPIGQSPSPQVPLAVELTCWVQGSPSRTVMAPGPTSAVPVAVVQPRPIIVCARATAAVLDMTPGSNAILPVNGETCAEFPG
jgi:hypothetical protein